jgi:ArsR family transcriptional regulator
MRRATFSRAEREALEDLNNFLTTDGSVAVNVPAPGIDCLKKLDPERMIEIADNAASFLKALSHEGRLMILCHLAGGEKSVGELEQLLGVRQAAVSQQLSRLRLEGLVATRRDGKAVFYSILDPKVLRTVTLLNDMFCVED